MAQLGPFLCCKKHFLQKCILGVLTARQCRTAPPSSTNNNPTFLFDPASIAQYLLLSSKIARRSISRSIHPAIFGLSGAQKGGNLRSVSSGIAADPQKWRLFPQLLFPPSPAITALHFLFSFRTSILTRPRNGFHQTFISIIASVAKRIKYIMEMQKPSFSYPSIVVQSLSSFWEGSREPFAFLIASLPPPSIYFSLSPSSVTLEGKLFPSSALSSLSGPLFAFRDRARRGGKGPSFVRSATGARCINWIGATVGRRREGGERGRISLFPAFGGAVFVWKRRRIGDEEWEDGTPSHFFPRNTAEKGKEGGGGHSRDKKGENTSGKVMTFSRNPFLFPTARVGWARTRKERALCSMLNVSHIANSIVSARSASSSLRVLKCHIEFCLSFATGNMCSIV